MRGFSSTRLNTGLPVPMAISAREEPAPLGADHVTPGAEHVVTGVQLAHFVPWFGGILEDWNRPSAKTTSTTVA